MSETKFTPGPWEMRRLIDGNGKPYATLYECHINLGPCMIWCPPGNVEQEANARLISASPDLYAACKKVVEHYGDPGGGSLFGLRAAIAKAEGVKPCTAIGPHHGDVCSGGRIQSPNAQFTRNCAVCKGTGFVEADGERTVDRG